MPSVLTTLNRARSGTVVVGTALGSEERTSSERQSHPWIRYPGSSGRLLKVCKPAPAEPSQEHILALWWGRLHGPKGLRDVAQGRGE